MATIKLKIGSGIPTTSDIIIGELALDKDNGDLYGGIDDSGSVKVKKLVGSGTVGTIWDASTNYKVGDIVSYDSNVYVSLLDNINKQPDNNSTEWLNNNYSEDVTGTSDEFVDDIMWYPRGK
jgi:hypothetical protein